MSSKKRRTAEKPARVPPAGIGTAVAAGEQRPQPSHLKWWIVLAGILAAFFAAFEVYRPALNGTFLFDDHYLPFMLPQAQEMALEVWLGVRPFLMATYWLNYQNSGLDPYPYHVVNVLFHIFNAVLVWLIVRKLSLLVGELGASRELLAAFAGGLFLFHPVQTESVAYIASRSETMSVFFFLAAYTVFLYRSTPSVSRWRIAAIVVLFGAAASTKEHTVVLPALLLLTDYYFTTPFRFEGIRRNVQLYAAIGVAGLLGLLAVWRVLSSATSAGFGVTEFTWQQYLFTQFRVIWTYLRLYVAPVNLSGDYHYPVSRSIFEHGAIFGLAGLLILAVLAWRYRRRYPLASFGYFAFLLLLAPTSSVVPIRDVIAERRMYLPFFCLLLITVALLRHIRAPRAALAAVLAVVLAVSAVAAHERNQVWSNPIAFWTDVTEKSPENARAHFQLAFAHYQANNCIAAIRGYERTAELEKTDERLLINWALALDCVQRPNEAIQKLEEAAKAAPSSALVYAQMGMIYGKDGRGDEALAALDKAQQLDPQFDMTYVYRGNVYAARGDFDTAAGLYRQALAINPDNETAQRALAIAVRQAAAP